MNVNVSSNFKKKTVQAVFAIVLFIITYIILLFLAVVLTLLCMKSGVSLIAIKPNAITIGMGLGLASLGLFILYFLFKFLFKKHTVDRSHLQEITAQDEPKLFAFIQEIVDEVQTDFPNKVYLSTDVNACVFYDSSFWSMLLPVPKNLQIGMGLVNTISEQEFKAILAHEFGHFSQRSMKVGSYVYHVNQVIYNLLYDNEGFDNLIMKWANSSWYFSIFVSIAVKIIMGIQWVLKHMYDFVNVSYMALSREMEFHADEIAAHVAGYLPLKESLLRMDLAEHSYQAVLAYYENKLGDNLKSKNIYREQEFVMHFLAEKSKLTFRNNLPLVTEQDLNKYNKSKLTIKNQWASHPEVNERIRALELTNIHKPEVPQAAILLFDKQERIQEVLTDKLFSGVTYAETPNPLAFEQFEEEYTQNFHKNSFPEEYNSYYDNKNPIAFDLHELTDFNLTETMETLFSNESVDKVYEYIAFDNDKNLLTTIAENEKLIKSFDYEGQKFKSDDAQILIPQLTKEQNSLKEVIQENDINIYKFFYNKALLKGNESVLKEKYLNFFAMDAGYEAKMAVYNDISNATGFVNVVTPIEQIQANLKDLLPFEHKLKSEIQAMKEEEVLINEISQQIMESFDQYLSKDWQYFDGKAYNNDHLQILYLASNNYSYLLSRKYFLVKLDLLNYQIAQLEN